MTDGPTYYDWNDPVRLGPRVFAAVVPPDCRCRWTPDGDDWRLVERADDCPLHGPGQPFDYWQQTDG